MRILTSKKMGIHSIRLLINCNTIPIILEIKYLTFNDRFLKIIFLSKRSFTTFEGLSNHTLTEPGPVGLQILTKDVQYIYGDTLLRTFKKLFKNTFSILRTLKQNYKT